MFINIRTASLYLNLILPHEVFLFLWHLLSLFDLLQLFQDFTKEIPVTHGNTVKFVSLKSPLCRVLIQGLSQIEKIFHTQISVVALKRYEIIST